LLGQNGHVLLQGVGGVAPKCSVNWQNADEASAGPTEGLLNVSDPTQVRETLNYWIAGALFGGDARAMVEYDAVYMRELGRYLEAGRAKRDVALIDQHLMGAVACARPDLVQVLRPPEYCCAKRVARKWFFMYMYLRSGEYPASDYSEQELEERRAKARPR
jgi:hypothetical protein